MKCLFSIHAGEYLVGSHIENQHKSLNVWIPSKDTGVDLLLTSRKANRAASIQVKFSKDYSSDPSMEPFQQKGSLLKTCGWHSIKREKLKNSPAQFWVFVLRGYETNRPDFIIIPATDLLRRLEAIFGQQATFRSYLWITKPGGNWRTAKCWEARDLNKQDRLRIVAGTYENALHDMTEYLAWDTLLKQLND